MQNAETVQRHARTRRKRIAAGEHLSAAVQPGTLPAGLRSSLLKAGSDRALRDLNVKGQREKPKWVQVMAARRRKTLVVCRPCHLNAHGGDWQPRSNRIGGSVPTVVNY